MFNFKDLGDLNKLASQAKGIQAKQDDYQSKVVALLESISRKLDEVLKELKKT